MTQIPHLKTLYRASEIAEIWNRSQKSPVIDHPQLGSITPRQYRLMNIGKPCPYCGQKMVGGRNKTNSKRDAINRGYQYLDKKGKKVINQAGSLFFHPHYVTLDHKINKARCPEKIFDYDNLQVICWRCNQEKGDDNSFDLHHICDYLDSLVDETLTRYPTV